MKLAIFTSDRYVKVVPIFLGLLERFWPSCPYPVEVVSNTVKPDVDVPVFLAGPDTGWSNQARAWLANQDEPVLIMLEDYFINGEPFDDEIARCLGLMETDTNIAFIRLVPWPGPTLPSVYPGLGTFERSQPYLFSLMATIWNPRHLYKMLPPDMNPWEVELRGSVMIKDYPARMLGAYDVMLPFRNGLKRGQWVDDVVEWLRGLHG